MTTAWRGAPDCGRLRGHTQGDAMGERETIKTFPGREVDIHMDGRLCIHVGECGRSASELFVAQRDPWCQPDAADAEDALEIVSRCPSGALTWTPKGEDVPAEDVIDDNVVFVANNGPLYARGDLQIDGAEDDMPGVRFRAALCRCGESKRKPFCDNSHEAAGFIDRGAVGSMDEIAEEPSAGPLQIRRVPNGPLLVAGQLTIVTSSGRAAWQGEKAALCRCGASKNKPFCDGAHKAAGFEAD